jgi:2'-5' RNA ligase
MRLFVAAEVPDSWRAIASAAVEAIARTSTVSMRIVHPSLLHITLRFLGEVPEERVPALDAALAHRVPPVDVALTLGAPSTFGPPARTQVVWLGVRGDIEGLRGVVRRVDLALADAGVAPADRRFAPHLTLARLDRRATAEERRLVAEVVAAMPPPEPFPLRVHAVALVRSTLGGPRPVYDTLARYGEDSSGS